MSEPEPQTRQGPVRPEGRGGKVRVPERLFHEMMKPLVFGNRQKQFTFFTAIASAGDNYCYGFATLIYWSCQPDSTNSADHLHGNEKGLAIRDSSVVWTPD